MLDLAANEGIVVKSGAWYNYNDERLGQGRENVKKLLHDNPELMEELDQKVRRKLGFLPPEEDEETADTEE